MQEILWEILESEADVKYFIDDSEGPAFLFFEKGGPVTGSACALYMNRVTKIREFRSLKAAEEFLEKIMKGMSRKMTVWKVQRFGRKGRKLFLSTKDPASQSPEPCQSFETKGADNHS